MYLNLVIVPSNTRQLIRLIIEEILVLFFLLLFLDESKQILCAANEEETMPHTAKVFLKLKGMTCASCVSLIEKSLLKKRGKVPN